MESAGKHRVELMRPNCVAPGLGYDAQSRRHNISDFIARTAGMATAPRKVV